MGLSSAHLTWRLVVLVRGCGSVWLGLASVLVLLGVFVLGFGAMCVVVPVRGCGVWKCESRVDWMGLAGHPASLLLGLELVVGGAVSANVLLCWVLLCCLLISCQPSFGGRGWCDDLGL